MGNAQIFVDTEPIVQWIGRSWTPPTTERDLLIHTPKGLVRFKYGQSKFELELLTDEQHEQARIEVEFEWKPLTHATEPMRLQNDDGTSNYIPREALIGAIVDAHHNRYFLVYQQGDGALEFDQCFKWVTSGGKQAFKRELEMVLTLGLELLFVFPGKDGTLTFEQHVELTGRLDLQFMSQEEAEALDKTIRERHEKFAESKAARGPPAQTVKEWTEGTFDLMNNKGLRACGIDDFVSVGGNIVRVAQAAGGEQDEDAEPTKRVCMGAGDD